MLEKIKSVLTRTPPTFPPATADQASTPDAVKAQVAKKQKELSQGKTRARVESLRAELEAARHTLAQAERAVGDQLVEGLDATVATDTMKQASDRVRVLESALAVAIQKDEAAQADLKEAERQVAIDAEAAARASLNALAPRGEELLAAVNQYCAELARDKEAVRLARLAIGDERHSIDVAELARQFELFAARAANPLTGQGLLPSRLMRFSSWSDCLAAVCGMRVRDEQR
jgi:hypothetical protein